MHLIILARSLKRGGVGLRWAGGLPAFASKMESPSVLKIDLHCHILPRILPDMKEVGTLLAPMRIGGTAIFLP